MQRYFFNLHNSIGPVLDEEGQVLSGPDEARSVALASIRSVLGNEMASGELDLNGRIDVTDEHGKVVMSVSFEQAIKVRHTNTT